MLSLLSLVGQWREDIFLLVLSLHSLLDQLISNGKSEIGLPVILTVVEVLLELKHPMSALGQYFAVIGEKEVVNGIFSFNGCQCVLNVTWQLETTF